MLWFFYFSKMTNQTAQRSVRIVFLPSRMTESDAFRKVLTPVATPCGRLSLRQPQDREGSANYCTWVGISIKFCKISAIFFLIFLTFIVETERWANSRKNKTKDLIIESNRAARRYTLVVWHCLSVHPFLKWVGTGHTVIKHFFFFLLLLLPVF